MGILQVLSEVSKSGSAEQVKESVDDLLAIAQVLQGQKGLSINTLVRKFRVKLVSRIGLRLLPGRANVARRDGEPGTLILWTYYNEF